MAYTTEEAMEANAFLASVLHGSLDSYTEEDASYPTPARDGTNRAVLDSWENYFDKPVRWVDVGPSPSPTPGGVVQWFMFGVPSSSQGDVRSPSLSSNYLVISPSQVSNSTESSCYDTPLSVPSTVSEGDSVSNGERNIEVSVESGRATRL